MDKITNVLTKVVTPKATAVAKAMVGLCPGSLQTSKVLAMKDVTAAIPLINGSEWEKYIVMEPQKPAPSTTAGRVQASFLLGCAVCEGF